MSSTTPKFELVSISPDHGRVEIALNGSIFRQPMSSPKAVVYMLGEDDFGGKPENLFGTVDGIRTVTKDLLTELGLRIIPHLRSNKDCWQVFVPAGGERLYIFTTRSMISREWGQEVLQQLQEVADSSGFSIEQTARSRQATEAAMAGSGRSSR